MPIDVSYEADGAWVVLTGRGIVTGQAMRSANDEIYGSQLLAAQQWQLIDFTDVVGLDVSTEEIRALAATDVAAARSNPRLRIAVAGKQDHTFDLSRMWQAFTEDLNLETQVFRTVEEARAWLREEQGDRSKSEETPHGPGT